MDNKVEHARSFLKVEYLYNEVTQEDISQTLAEHGELLFVTEVEKGVAYVRYLDEDSG